MAKQSYISKMRLCIRGLRLINASGKPILLSRTLAAAFSAATPFINIYLGAQIISELAGPRDRSRLVWLVGLTIGLNLAAALGTAVLRRWQEYCDSRVWQNIRRIYSDKMLRLAFADAESPEVQHLHSELEQHHRGMGFGLGMSLSIYDGVVGGLFRVGLSVAFAFSLFSLRIPADGVLQFLDSPLVVAAVIGVLAVNIFFAPYLTMVGGRAFARNADANNQGNRTLVYYFYSLVYGSYLGADIRIYDQKRLTDVHAQDCFDTRGWLGIARYAARFGAASTVISRLCDMIIFGYVALKAYAGAFGVGSIVQYVGAITQFGSGFASIMNNLGRLSNNHEFLEKVFVHLDRESAQHGGTDAVTDTDDLRIEFADVSFKYPGADTYALKNLSLVINPRRRLAVVGENGSGKTTMIKLLTRLYAPESGEITLNGKNIRDYDHAQYMALFGVVLQDFALLPFTIGQNVACGTDVDAPRAIDALQKVGFNADIGLETYLYKNFEDSGIEPSGGEAQKIAMARALYKDSPFVILDEPTAALDPKAEYEIYTKFDVLVGSKTAVYISHRLASCKFCDTVAVFHDGRVIEQGSHDELMTMQQGKYRELFMAQAQYYV